MGSFRQQPTVNILQQRTETIGILDNIVMVMPGDGQLIMERIFTPRDNPAKKAALIFTG